MLVGIQFGMPRQGRELKAAASQVETQNNAATGTVRASMFYFRKKEGGKEVDGLSTLKKFQTAWKTGLEHYARYPFAAGMKLLPAALVEKFLEVNNKFKDEQAQVWLDWVDDEYPQWLNSAPERMGALYDAADFPTQQDCMKRFICEVTVVPLPEAAQWQRISVISPDLAHTMETTTNAKIESAIAAAQAQTWEDVMKPIQHIVDTLGKEGGKVKIYDSLIGNVLSIVDLVPSMNLSNDPKLAELAATAKESLSAIKPDDLRSSAEARANALATAKSIVTTFTPFKRQFA